MNNDDTFKNTENNNHASAGLTPELEVRVVTWVLGEATSAEAAELARMAAENAALADFKRRIEAVHGLVGTAVRPAGDAPLQLSDERRAKVLAVIGEDTAEASEERTEDRGSATPRWVLAWNKWALPMAACITLCALLGAVLFPAVGASKKAAERAMHRRVLFEAAPKRPEPSNTLLGPSGSAEMPTDRVALADVPMVTFATKSAASEVNTGSAGEGDNFAAVDAPAAATAMPPPAPMAQPVLRLGRERTLTLGGANTYADGTVITAGTLAVDANEQTKSLTKVGSGQLAVDESRLFADNKEKALTNEFTASAPAVPASPVAGRGDSLVVNGYASSSSMTMDADRTEKKSDVGRLGGSAGKDQSRAVGYVSNDKTRQTVTITAGTSQEWEAQTLPSDGVASGQSQDLVTASSASVTSGAVASAPVSNQFQAAKERTKALKNVAVSTRQAGVFRDASDKKAEQGDKALEEDAPVSRKPAQPAFDESLRLETATSQQAISTFSLHVSDASFRIAKAALARGEAPDPASIRPEEFYNAFDYGDPSAVAGEPVACRIEQSAHPFLQQRNLVRIAMKVPATGRGAGQPLRLTVLLDTSGSMEREDRAATVKRAMAVLVSLLGPNDRLA